MVLFLPIQLTAPGADGKRGGKVDQKIRLGNDLPHGLHIGMLLCNMAAGIAMFFKTRYESGFARAAGTNNTDKRSSPGDKRSSPGDKRSTPQSGSLNE